MVWNKGSVKFHPLLEWGPPTGPTGPPLEWWLWDHLWPLFSVTAPGPSTSQRLPRLALPPAGRSMQALLSGACISAYELSPCKAASQGSWEMHCHP